MLCNIRPYSPRMATTLFSSSDLVAYCGVDLKTIHNWVSKKRIKAGRTPGGHYRFRAATVLDVLTRLDVPIPPEVAAAAAQDEADAKSATIVDV